MHRRFPARCSEGSATQCHECTRSETCAECGFPEWPETRELIEEHLGPRTAAGKLQEAGALMENASPHHRVVAHVKGADVTFGIEAKHPDAASQEPLLFSGTFVFPNDEAGRAAMAALEKHVKTGAPATVPSTYIKEFDIPALLKPFVGDQIQEITMLPAPGTRAIIADLAIETPSGRAETAAALRLKGTQCGTEEVTVVCDEPDCPYHLTLTANAATRPVKTSIAVDISGLNVKRALEAIRVRNALAEGGQVTIRNADTGLPITSGIVPAGLVEPTPERFEDFLSDLVFIQAKTRTVISVPEREFEPRDVREPRELAQALRTGYRKVHISNINVTMTREGVEHVVSQPSLGKPIRNKLLNLVKMSGNGVVCVDFEGVPLLSSSFADEAFGKLFLTLGPVAFMQRVKLHNMMDTVEALVNKALSQRMQVGLSDADA